MVKSLNFIFTVKILFILGCVVSSQEYPKIGIKDKARLKEVTMSMDSLLLKINHKDCSREIPCRMVFVGNYYFVGIPAEKHYLPLKKTDSLYSNFTENEFLLFKENISYLLNEDIYGWGFDRYCRHNLYHYRDKPISSSYDDEFLAFIQSEAQLSCIKSRFNLIDQKNGIVLFLRK